MTRTKEELWERVKKYYTEFHAVGLAMDLSRVNFGDDYFEAMAGRIQEAFAAMAELENGAIANPDENRMVGHYWLRNPELAPNEQLRGDVTETNRQIKTFVRQVHADRRFRNLLLIGIGGSALGPEFVADALGTTNDAMKP